MVYEIVIWLILFCLLCIGVRFKRETPPFEKDDSTQIKGLCCLLIVSHHLYTWNYFPHNISVVGLMADWLGPLAVGVFFFLSAYGLILSYERGGKKYLKKILLVKIPTLYLCEVFVNIINFFVVEYPTTTLSPLEQFLKITELNKFRIGQSEGQWFINTLIVCYLIFVAVYFLFDKLKDKKFSAIMTGLVILTLFVLLYKWIYEYRRAVTCFCLGLVYTANRQVVNEFCKKYFKFLLPLSFAMFVGATIVDDEQLGALALCVFVVILMQNVKFRSPVMAFVGRFGLEIYLIHCLFIKIFLRTGSFGMPIIIYNIVIPYTCAILAGLLLYYLRLGITLLIKKIAEKIKGKPKINESASETT